MLRVSRSGFGGGRLCAAVGIGVGGLYACCSGVWCAASIRVRGECEPFGGVCLARFSRTRCGAAYSLCFGVACAQCGVASCVCVRGMHGRLGLRRSSCLNEREGNFILRRRILFPESISIVNGHNARRAHGRAMLALRLRERKI